VRMLQTSRGLSGGFWPTMWPLFQLGMVLLPCRPPQPQRPMRVRKL
jgi:hypothetical protein